VVYQARSGLAPVRWLNAEHAIFAHHPRDTIVVDGHAATAKLDDNAPVVLAAAMFEDDLLDGVCALPSLLRRAGLEKTVGSGAADLGQPAHRLKANAAFERHHFPDGFPEAVSPAPVAI
jgi:hypothetical protein